MTYGRRREQPLGDKTGKTLQPKGNDEPERGIGKRNRTVTQKKKRSSPREKRQVIRDLLIP